MADRGWIKLDELRQPGMRRILDAMRALQREAPGLLEEASVAAAVLAKKGSDGVRAPE